MLLCCRDVGAERVLRRFNASCFLLFCGSRTKSKEEKEENNPHYHLVKSVQKRETVTIFAMGTFVSWPIFCILSVVNAQDSNL
jgi:nitrate reductase NapE component